MVQGKTDFPYVNTSESSLFQPTSLMSNYQTAGAYLTTAMASDNGSVFVNTSQSSLFEQKSHTSIFQQTSGMSNYQSTGNYLTTAMASDNGSVFVNTSQSSLFEQKSHTSIFQQTSGMTAYQSTGAYLTTAAQSNHTHGSAPSITGNISVTSNSTGWSLAIPSFLTTAMASDNGSVFVNTSQSSLFEQKSHTSIFQQTSLMSNYQTAGAYLTTAMASDGGSNFVNTSQSSLFEQKSHTSIFQQTSLMSNYQTAGAYLTTAMASDAGTNFVNTSQSSLFEQNSHTSVYQLSSLMTNYQPAGAYLTTAMASNAGSNFVNTSQSTDLMNTSVSTNFMYTSQSSLYEQKSHTSIFQQTSLMSNYQTAGAYLTTAMASDAGTNFVNTSVSSAFEQKSHTSIFQQTSLMSNYQTAGAYLTTAAQSNHTHGSAPSITGNISVTSNSTGWSLAIPSFLTTAMASDNGSVFVNTSQSSLFEQTSHTSVYQLSANMTNYLGTGYTTHTHTEAAHSLSYYATGNSTQVSSMTLAEGALTFEGLGIASVGMSNNRVVISVPAGGGAGDGVNIVQLGTTGTTGTAFSSISGTVQINGSSGIIVSQNNSNQIVIMKAEPDIYVNGWNLVGANTAGTTGSTNTTEGAIYLSGGNNVTLSGNSNTVIVSVQSFPNHSYVNGWSLAGNNTAGTNNSAFTTDGRVFLSGRNNVTLSGNSNTIVISGPSCVETISLAGNIAAGANSSVIVDTNGLIYISGGSNITLSGTSNSVGIIGPPVGTQQYWINVDNLPVTQIAPIYSGSVGAGGNSTATTMSFWVEPVILDQVLAFKSVGMGMYASASAVNSQQSLTARQYLGLYTLNDGTALSLVSSFFNDILYSASSNTAVSFQAQQRGSTYASTGFTGNSLGQMSNFHSVLVYANAAEQTLPVGQYFIVYGASVSTAGGNSYINHLMVHHTNMFQGTAFTPFGISTANSVYALRPFNGWMSTVLNSNATAMPSAINIANNISTATSTASSTYVNRMCYFNFRNY